jgi:hypothetical protein
MLRSKCLNECLLTGPIADQAERLLREASELRHASQVLNVHEHKGFAIQAAVELELHAREIHNSLRCAGCPHGDTPPAGLNF